MTFTTSHSGEICCCCCVFKKIYYKLFWLILLGLEIAKSNLTLDYLGRIYFPSSSLKRFHYESEIIQTVNKESVKTFLPLSSSGKKKKIIYCHFWQLVSSLLFPWGHSGLQSGASIRIFTVFQII